MLTNSFQCRALTHSALSDTAALGRSSVAWLCSHTTPGATPFHLLVLLLFFMALPAGAAAAPTISSLTPTSAAVGASVTIAGSAFGSTQGTSTVKFNGTTAAVTTWSGTSIVAIVPTGATTGNVVVTVAGSASNGKSFTVLAAPSITSLSPTSGAVTASVTIAGANFGATQGTSTVKFNGTTATVTTWSATSIVAAVPAGATTGNVVVHASGVDSNGVSFTVLPTASITSLTPTSGAVGAPVTIAGANFGATQGTSTIKFNGTTATATTWSATSLVATVPVGATSGNVVVTVGGGASNAKTFTVVAAPHITSLSPTSGAVGASVTIAGTNFGATQGTSTVKFNGTTATVTTWSATSIAVPVPAGATTGTVVVHASGVDSNGVSFTVLPTPSITSLTPTSGAVGASVTVAGTNFGATQGTSTIKFNGTTATATTWSATSVVATVPAGATSGNVVVTVGGVASNGASFSVVAAPSITSVSPTSAAVGASVTIAGTNFGATQGTSTVKFNGTTATVTTWSATSIVVPVPAGATTGNVVVHASGVDSNGVSFTVLPTPSITSLTPISGAVGALVTVAGSNFGATQGTSTIKFNGTTATATTWSATSIVATVPVGATTGNVVVTVGGVASNGMSFSVVAAPSITSVSPASAAVSALVTIAGANFGATQGTSTITFNGTAATVTTWSATSIAAPVPVGATTGNVVVHASGVDSNGVSFTVVPTPSITSLTPTAGAVGASVTIAGANFGATQGTSTVTFNGTTATATTWSATSIVATVPAGATTGNVVVTVAGGASNGTSFTVAPSITSVSPPTGDVGASVTIGGANFGASQGGSTITFNGTAAAVSSWTDTSLSTTVPAGATSGPIVVTVSGNASSAVQFTVAPPPILTSAIPSSAQVGATVTITGTNFGVSQGTSTVKFNGTMATPSYWSNTAMTATVPANATSGNIVVTVGGAPSNGLAFTVLVPGTISGTVTRATGGSSVSGATVEARLAGVAQGSTTSAANGTYSIPALDPGTYEVSTLATGLSTELRHGVAVTASTTTTVNVAMSAPGSIGGRVTQANGVTPIAGAALIVYEGSAQKATAATNGAGDYTIGALHPATYTVQASSVGYRTNEQGVVVAESATTTSNFSLEGATAGAVLYAYDQLGRLVEVTDPSGESAIYRYDAVGNIVAIERPGTSVSISAFSPTSGAVGTTVTIYGTRFSATPSQNTVTFVCGTGCTVNATVGAATTTQLTVTVPATATTGAIAVTTPNGSATSANVFTVGASNGPTITGFTPSIGVAGTAITVSGSNFDSVPLNDRTTLNVTLTPVSAASATTLTTTVPALVGSGPMSVATPAGIAVSANDFFVPPIPYVAADVTFTSRTTIGAAQAVSMNTANTIGLVTFAAAKGQRISLQGSNATGFNQTFGCDLNVSVLRPDTATLAPATCMDNGGFMEPLVLASTGTYTVFIHPEGAATGSLSVTVYDVPPDPSMTITPGGAAVTVTTMAPGQNATLTFSGTAGHRISLVGSDVSAAFNQSFGCDLNIIVKKPDGSTLTSTCMDAGGFIDATELPTTGMYTILVDPWFGPQTGSITLRLYDVPADSSASITPGGSSVVVTTTVPGQNAMLTFSGTVGQRISLVGTDVSPAFNQSFGCDLNIIVKKPDGSALTSSCMDAGGFIDATELPTTGTYTILVDPWFGPQTGSITLRLYDVPADSGVSITPGGSSVTVTTTVPGQNATLTFAGTAGQRISLLGSSVSPSFDPSFGCDLNIIVKKPDGSTLTSSCMDAGGFIDATSLPTTDTYTILVDPWFGPQTGSITLSLYDISDISGTITVGGSAVPVSISTPGQGGRLTFSGTTGQQVTVHLTTNTIGTTTVALLAPDNSTLTSAASSAASFNLSTQTLPATGTYAITIDPSWTNVGSITVSVTNP